MSENNPVTGSRDAILHALRHARPEEVPLPEIEIDMNAPADLVTAFKTAAEAAAVTVREVGEDDVQRTIRETYGDAEVVAASGAAWNFSALHDHPLEAVDVLVCRGTFGVAENGAVWLYESQMGRRAAPYLAQNLVLVLDRGEIVTDMHAAYARLHVDAEGFGAFIAGPSKTADIEQSLVIGAHGPRSLTVLIV